MAHESAEGKKIIADLARDVLEEDETMDIDRALHEHLGEKKHNENGNPMGVDDDASDIEMVKPDFVRRSVREGKKRDFLVHGKAFLDGWQVDLTRDNDGSSESDSVEDNEGSDYNMDEDEALLDQEDEDDSVTELDFNTGKFSLKDDYVVEADGGQDRTTETVIRRPP